MRVSRFATRPSSAGSSPASARTASPRRPVHRSPTGRQDCLLRSQATRTDRAESRWRLRTREVSWIDDGDGTWGYLETFFLRTPPRPPLEKGGSECCRIVSSRDPTAAPHHILPPAPRCIIPANALYYSRRAAQPSRWSLETRPVATHSATKMLPCWSKHASCGCTKRPSFQRLGSLRIWNCWSPRIRSASSPN